MPTDSAGMEHTGLRLSVIFAAPEESEYVLMKIKIGNLNF